MTTAMTPLAEAAAYHLNDTKDSQRRAMRLALALVDELPFAATDMHIIQMRQAFRFTWGVRLDVLRADSDLFDEVATVLGARRETKVSGVGSGSVARYDLLLGELNGVPFKIRAYMGTQLVAVA